MKLSAHMSKLGDLLLWQRLGSVVILVAMVGQFLGFWPLSFFQRLEWISYDMRVRATLAGNQDPSLVMIDLDEKSLREVGHWPWPRDQLAELVNRLFDREGIAILGMDVIFAEAEHGTIQRRWQEHSAQFPALKTIPMPPSGDHLFAAALKDRPVVMGYYFQHEDDEHLPPSGQLGQAAQVQNRQALAQLPWFSPKRYSANLPVLQQSAATAGFFDNPAVDADGVFRRVPLVQRWQNQLYPSLPLAMLQTLLGDASLQIDVQEGGDVLQLEAIEVGGFRIPTDAHGSVLVPYQGGRGHFESISAVDVLQGRVPEGRLAGAMAVLGSSAPGLMDLRSTPVASIYPGPEIHLTVLSGLLQQNFKADPPFIMGLEVVILVIFGVLMTVYYPRLSAPILFVFSLILLAVWTGGIWWAWQEGWVVPLANGLVMIVGIAGLNLLFNLWRESREKSWVTQCFGQYIPPELVEEMVEHPEIQGLEAHERDLSVLFTDIRGFTSFSEKIPPSELSAVMNRLLSPLTEAIHAKRGTIDKYMGDAIMAFWGAPLPDKDHAEHALAGAFAMLQALENTNVSFQKEGLPALKMGVGINSGMMSVGNMGSSFRMAYTVLGDNVNLGSRLESLTKHYGVSILVSESTQAAAPRWLFRRVDQVRVKGRARPLWIFEPLGLIEHCPPEQKQLAQAFEAALDAYYSRDFAKAQQLFQAFAAQYPQDHLSHLYLSRIETYLAAPPADDWDGVWTHTEK